MIGDEFSVVAGKNTVVGVIMAPASDGDTVLTVTPTIAENVRVGMYVTIGTTTLRAVRITTTELELEPPGLSGIGEGVQLPAGTTPILLNHRVVDKCLIDREGMSISFGLKGLVGSKLTKNYPLTIQYKNNNGEAKILKFHVEYYFDF